jgi:hypothetical protein
MNVWKSVVVLALLVGVAAVQEKTQEKKKCGMAGLVCPKEGKCEGECRTICDRAGETLTAARKLAGVKMKKEIGQTCECTAGSCSASGCEGCDYLKTKVFTPLMKDRVSARMKDWKKDVMHAVKAKDGKTSQAKCTFLKGALCEPCADTLSDDILKKLRDMMSDQKK